MKRARTRGYLQNSIWYLGLIHYRVMLVKMVKQCSLHRVLQAIYAVVEWKLHRTTCSSRPFAFRIEPTATCNLRCPLCSTTHRKFNPGDVRVMTFSLFQTILEQIRNHAWRMTFYMEGEPMMHPQLFEMIELSTCDRHLFTSFSTNFTLMRENLLSPLSNLVSTGFPLALMASPRRRTNDIVSTVKSVTYWMGLGC